MKKLVNIFIFFFLGYTICFSQEKSKEAESEEQNVLPMVIQPGDNTYYRDYDGDGYGDPNLSITAGEIPLGYVPNNDDCDDSNPNIYPGAVELNDGVDNDCDGQIDEGFPAIQIPMDEGFESGWGQWTANNGSGSNLWRRESGGTSSSSTGPSSANEGNYYVYMESSSPNIGVTGTLTSPILVAGSPSKYVVFDYHMYGANMGTLRFEVSTNSGASWTTLWTQTGDQGNQWQTEEISLEGYYDSPTIVLRFRGTTGSSYRSDMAIDNIRFNPNSTIGEAISFSNDRNYFYKRTYQNAFSSIPETNTAFDAMESIVYYDGLGGEMREISIREGGNQEDLIKVTYFDLFYRKEKDYLYYPEDDGEIGSFRQNSSNLYSYYSNNYSQDFYGNTGTNVYSEVNLEESPRNRVLEQAAPGSSWVLDRNSDSDHTIKYNYDTNVSNEVRKYIVNLSNTYFPSLVLDGYYTANELYKLLIKDENWSPNQLYSKEHTIEEFKDKEGRVILKRAYGKNNLKHDTYYVYDKFGNLTYKIPPLVNTADGVSATELSELCYQYKYDYRNRLIEKKIPGKGWEYLVYNQLDQVILTQDSNLKTSNQWLFTKYDALGRETYTGIFTDTSNRNRSELQTEADNTNLYTQWETLTAAAMIDGTTIYYTNNSFPKIGLTLHQIEYYDKYEFIANEDSFFNNPTTVYGEAVDNRTNSLVTGGKIRVLGTSYWITSVNYYDSKGRVIYVATKNNYLGTTDVVENKLDFVGKVEESKATHQKGSNTPIVTVDTFEYDHTGRILKQSQTLDGNEEVLAEYIYDELGKLISKSLGSGLQNVDFGYNVRGWLKNINNVNNIGNNLFAYYINYDQATHGGTAQYNGNIVETEWRTASDNVLRWYSYTYDPINRLKTAVNNDGKYNVSNISYDKNGGILSLTRNGWQNSSNYTNLDVLTYNYDQGNKLLKVTDTGNKSYGFKDGSNTDNDYSYDSNGNLKEDKNKGIASITYNHLNLPVTVTYQNSTKKIDYVYDAEGKKQIKTVKEGNAVTTTKYAGNFVYKNDVLELFNHKEGYVEPTIHGYKYIYYIKDHQGNTRIAFADDDGDGKIDLVRNSVDIDGDNDYNNEIRKELNYYPFGMLHEGYNTVIQGVENNLKTFQEQEMDRELNLNWHHFKYRTYDASIGKFLQIDPLASTYDYNNTYAFAENKVINGVDLEGLEVVYTYDGSKATAIGTGPQQGGQTLEQIRSQHNQEQAMMDELASRNSGTLRRAATVRRAPTLTEQMYSSYTSNPGLSIAHGVGVGMTEMSVDAVGGFALNALSSASWFKKAKSVWRLDKFERGRRIERMLGANMKWPKNFPVIDKITNGIATSIKSIDLDAKTYNEGNKLLSTLKGYIKKLDNFEGARWGVRSDNLVDVQQGRDFLGKALEIAVETGKGTKDQWRQIDEAVKFALDRNIDVNIRFID